MKICSKEHGLFLPLLGLYFEEANKPYEVTDKEAEKVLRNSTFYEYKGEESSTEIIRKPIDVDIKHIKKISESMYDIKIDKKNKNKEVFK